MTASNLSMTSMSNMMASSTTTDLSRPIAYMLHSIPTLTMLACVVLEDSQLDATTEFSVMNKKNLAYMILRFTTIFDVTNKIISYAREYFPQDKQRMFVREESCLCIVKGCTSIALYMMPIFNKELPCLSKINCIFLFSSIQDSVIMFSEQTIPKFFGSVVKKIDREHLLHSLFFRSKIAATQSTAQTTLTSSSSRSDSRCRQIYNGMWSVLTTCANGIKRGFDCRRKPN